MNYDLVFTGARDSKRQRVLGKLHVKATGKTYAAVSGSRTLLPLPNGGYIAKNLRIRKKASMQLNVLPEQNDGGGMCFPAWSVDVEPLFSSRRTLLRIHPDGNLPGTRGCIGILGYVHNCFEDIEQALGDKSNLSLLVSHDNNDPKING